MLVMRGWEDTEAEAGPRAAPLDFIQDLGRAPRDSPRGHTLDGLPAPQGPHCHTPRCRHHDRRPPLRAPAACRLRPTHRQNPHLIRTAKETGAQEG